MNGRRLGMLLAMLAFVGLHLCCCSLDMLAHRLDGRCGGHFGPQFGRQVAQRWNAHAGSPCERLPARDATHAECDHGRDTASHQRAEACGARHAHALAHGHSRGHGHGCGAAHSHGRSNCEGVCDAAQAPGASAPSDRPCDHHDGGDCSSDHGAPPMTLVKSQPTLPAPMVADLPRPVLRMSDLASERGALPRPRSSAPLPPPTSLLRQHCALVI